MATRIQIRPFGTQCISFVPDLVTGKLWYMAASILLETRRERRPRHILNMSKNVFTNHLFCDWLYVDFTSEWYTCSCQRVNCKPHFLKCESESFLSRVYSCVLESYLVLDKAGLAKVLEYMIGIKFRNIGWKRKAWIMKLIIDVLYHSGNLLIPGKNIKYLQQNTVMVYLTSEALLPFTKCSLLLSVSKFWLLTAPPSGSCLPPLLLSERPTLIMGPLISSIEWSKSLFWFMIKCSHKTKIFL